LSVVVVESAGESSVIVADSYNHKLKRVTDLKAKNPDCATLKLTGAESQLNEPGGMVTFLFI
jgi:hypothetical protein